MKSSLPFRQVHLDFHTSPHLEDIGSAFDPDHFVRTLQSGQVNSVTLFATCHHGYSYYETEVGEKHPHLSFDLLRGQFDAVKAAGIRAPIYLTAGVNNWASNLHPEWRAITVEGRYAGWAKDVVEPGFHQMCFNTPYLDLLCDQVREVVRKFPACDGIFLDIISQSPCCCKWCMASMHEKGLDAAKAEDRERNAREVLEGYYQRITAAAREQIPDMPVFHNSGHISRGSREILKYFSHLELESLPTGGWGYDHFPLSARYAAGLNKEIVGMTGKFHTTWGEFGGFKHPNALRYECAAMLAHGAKCNVGDQLHPSGELDASTYKIIGEAFNEVAVKEPWCVDAVSVADIGILSSEAVNASGHRNNSADTGATRVLLEEQLLFDVLDADMDFSPYAALLLPDDVQVDLKLKGKLDAYLASGGKLILSGDSGIDLATQQALWDLGAEVEGPSPYSPDYVLPAESCRPEFIQTPMVMYARSRRIRVTAGASLGEIFDPYFNRDFRHFSSHQHTPAQREPSGYQAGVVHGSILYFAHPVFSMYAAQGAVALRHFIARALRQFMGTSVSLETNLPSTARVVLTRQASLHRYVLHLLYAPTVSRGGELELSGGTTSVRKSIEVIEDLIPLRDIFLRLRISEAVDRVTLEPEGRILPHQCTAEGEITVTLDTFTCSAMLSIPTAP